VAGAPQTGFGDQVACDLGTLAPAEMREVGIWVRVDRETADGTELLNEACVDGGTSDPDPENDCASAANLVLGEPDLEVTKAAVGQVVGPDGAVALEADQVTAGLVMSYTLTVANHSGALAENVVVEDRLPAGLVLEEVTSTQGRCTWGVPGDPDHPMTCNLGALAAGEEVTIQVRAAVLASVAGGTRLTNEARVSGELGEHNNADDLDVNVTLVSAWAGLSVQKEQDPPVVTSGGEVEYTITVANAGPSDAPGVIVSDTMPAQLADVSWSCTGFGGATCPAAGTGDLYVEVDLPAGGWVVFTVQALRAEDGEPLVNTAEVVLPAGVADPNPADNQATASNNTLKTYLPLVMRTSP
jgi:uncharacterized repeat protein (TIGR01451 family)